MKKVMSFRGEFGFLSNMYKVTFEWDGRTYESSEAAFQSAKSLDPEVRDKFSRMSGFVAKRAGKSVALRKDWERVKLDIMEEIVRAKFSQNPRLLKLLIETGDMELVEGNTWHDTYWGVDAATGYGDNHLGIILMKVRAELGGAAYIDEVVKRRIEEAEKKRIEKLEIEEEMRSVKETLEILPLWDLTGMECETKAFGKVRITRHEGDYIYFEARGAEKKFSLPGCLRQGFITVPGDLLPRTILTKYELIERLRALEKKLEALK